VPSLIKLWRNLLTPRALRVLGVRLWLRSLMMFLHRLPAIIRSRDLRPLDRELAADARAFTVRGARLLFDCAHSDFHVRDGTFAFGAVREIYVRDCYLAHHRATLWNGLGTVVDAGANRGAFSVMAAARSRFVLCVEAQAHFASVIRHNMQINGFANYAIETAKLGSGGQLLDGVGDCWAMEELLDRYGIAHADFVKLDIEGSEFALFDRPAWLRRVGALSMEVHPRHGDPGRLLRALREHGFEFRLADENLRPARCARAAYVYAARPGAADLKRPSGVVRP